jgi:hypothetical protein
MDKKTMAFRELFLTISLETKKADKNYPMQYNNIFFVLTFFYNSESWVVDLVDKKLDQMMYENVPSYYSQIIWDGVVI